MNKNNIWIVFLVPPSKATDDNHGNDDHSFSHLKRNTKEKVKEKTFHVVISSSPSYFKQKVYHYTPLLPVTIVTHLLSLNKRLFETKLYLPYFSKKPLSSLHSRG